MDANNLAAQLRDFIRARGGPAAVDIAELRAQAQQLIQQHRAASSDAVVPLTDFGDEPGLAAARDLVRQYVEATGEIHWHAKVQPGSFPTGRAILDADPDLQLAAIHAALDVLAGPRDPETKFAAGHVWHLHPLLSQLTKRQLPYDERDVVRILDRLRYLIQDRSTVHAGRFVQQIDRYVAERGLSEIVRAGLTSLRGAYRQREHFWGADGRKLAARIDDLLAGSPVVPFSLDTRDDWGCAARDALEEREPETRGRWQALLQYCATATGAKPSGTWLKGAAGPIARLGESAFVELAVAWLGLLGQARPADDAGRTFYVNDQGYRVPPALITSKNGDLLKGLAWCCALVPDDRLAAALGAAASASFKKIPQFGAPSAKVGNACVFALGALAGTRGVAQLSRLEQQLKLPSAHKMVESALDAAAQRNGLTRDDLAEITVPTFGLVDGRLSRLIGDCFAEIAVTGARVDLSWRTSEGKLLRNEPAEVKRAHPDARKALKRLVDDIRATLTAQRDRIEALFLTERVWDLPIWRERYLDHPLLGALTRSLIWSFETAGRPELGAWLGGQIVDSQDRPSELLRDGTRVRLWHPLGWEPASVLAWREWLQRHEITQPFKQAHREIYLLTDAERATATYSNRFAAHILRQHQLSALCQQRGWRYRLQGAWDGANVPTIELPRWNLRAELWCEGIEDPSHQSAAGIFLYLTSDQVRFARPGRGRTVPLVEIPALVFSEVMRDVDLFVGVCSIGNDPTWGEREPGEQVDYWHDYAFGELAESARTRRDVLERLLPRLTKLSGRWELTDRFLVIRGDRRTYKIHLGSGNILMEPNDQYLCIVPRAGGEIGSDRLFLPFEGDSILAVILSKAFLLADDRAIKDPSILRQIS